jgi:imidazolonepropionase-like amidohydrolase
VVIQAQQVMTMGPEGTVGPRVVVVRDGRITSITRDRPDGLPADAEELSAAYLTPGFIDARTTLGLSGLVPAKDDRDETSAPNQAHLRALDAYDLTDAMLRHALESGVTVVQTGPGNANSIGGQAGIFRTAGSTVREAVVRFPSALVLSLDETAKLTYGGAGRYPSTRMANVGILRQAFLDAQGYTELRNGQHPPARDLKKEALAAALAGDVPVLVSAERADELVTALRLAGEFGLRTVLVGATEAHVVLDRLAGAGVPVLLGPPGDALFLPGAARLILETPKELAARGIPFALVTGDDEAAPRSSLLEMARAAVRGGLTREEALAAVTLAPARILGLDGQIGSVQAGRDADLVLFNGDPLSHATRVIGVMVRGVIVRPTGE